MQNYVQVHMHNYLHWLWCCVMELVTELCNFTGAVVGEKSFTESCRRMKS